ANNSFAFHRGYTGHEHLAEFGLINMNGRMYDPVLGRFLSPDPYVQSPLFSQNFNRYAYCWNNPLRFNDPDGEWIHIAIGALVGGVINWGAHGFRMDMEGLKAFGIGAATGAIGAATFGVGLGAMGVAGAGLTSLGAVGGGGFLAGAGAGLFSYMASSPVLYAGNHYMLGDPMPTPEEYMLGAGLSVLGSGLTQGLAASAQGGNFLDGSINESSLLYNAQVSAINESQKAPMAAVDNIDDALMERVGNKTVGNFLDSRIAGQTTDAIVPYYPSNNGATSAGWKYDYLNVGDIVDRFGSEYGTFVSRPGTPIPMRALPPNNSGAYNTYEILKPIPVMKSTIAPAFGQPGGGIQYKLPFTIKELKGIGYIK
ncbi:MAG: glycohydrolase toxin TNT-related protein, partial [Prevotella sp.]|nr:glycohydrolase toxin TNT-related protein [Prevotella sp.]